ncbi:MAG: acyltransferase family protein [Gammaproteobacteria bacterium]
MNSEQKIPYRPDIQGLRAIAIAIVVLAHANIPGFAGGFVGVDVFFVLSGFLITGLLVKERLETGTIRYATFLSRRLRRLLPALLVMLVTVLFLVSMLLSSYEAQMQTGSLVYSATWTSNFYFAFAEFDYFAALKAKDVFLHTWSLGIEEQFYAVWPWLVSLSFVIAAASSKPDRDFRSLFTVIAIFFVVGIGLCLYWAQTAPLLSFYMMPSRGWQFALGASVFVYSHRSRLGWSGDSGFLHSTTTMQLAGALGLVLIIGSAVLLHTELNYPGYYALFPSIGAALLIHAGTGTQAPAVSRILAGRAFVWLGDRSYSLYLWHWPVLLLGGVFGLAKLPAGIATLVGIAILLAVVSYHWIERPFWKGRFSATPTRLVTLMSALAIVVTFGLSHSLTTVVFKDAVASANHGDTDSRADVPKIFVAFKCDSWYHSSEVVPCVIGDSNARYTAVLIGDSIGTQWASLLPEIYKEPDWQVLVLAKSACAIADLEYYYKPAGEMYDVCTEWRNRSIEYIERLQPDIVFIGSSSTYSFSKTEWVGGTERVIAKLASAVRHVVIIPGTPVLSFDGSSCLKEPYRFTSRLRNSQYICEEALMNTASDDVARYLGRAASGIPNAHILNLNDLVCPGRSCAARSRDGLTVFRDHQHLTASFVVAQTPAVLSRLNSIGLGPSYLKDIVSLAD